MTTFDEIIEDRCLLLIDDYKITKLWENTHDETGAVIEEKKWDYWNYVDQFLLFAINRFAPDCDNLELVPVNDDERSRTFANDLTEMELEVLTWFYIAAWARREINNSSQLQLKLKVSSGFTFSSEGSTLKAKLIWIDSIEEEANRKLNQYQLRKGNICNYNW